MTVRLNIIWHAGFYADQRDSRQVIRQVSAGRRVLDLCTYSGDYAVLVSLLHVGPICLMQSTHDSIIVSQLSLGAASP